MTADLRSKSATCVTHHYACDCREEHFRRIEEENERLKKLLAEAREDLLCGISERYPVESRIYPSQRRHYENEMRFIQRIDEALALEEA